MDRFLFGKIQILFNHRKTSYARIFTVPLNLEVWLPEYLEYYEGNLSVIAL